MSLVINALIGFANVSTVAVSGFMKVPQVYSLIKSKSPAGVSLYGLLLEFTGYLIMMSYNFYSRYPLASYFEYPLLVVQDFVMLLVMLHLLDFYSSSLIVPMVAGFGLVIGIGGGYLPSVVITILVRVSLPSTWNHLTCHSSAIFSCPSFLIWLWLRQRRSTRPGWSRARKLTRGEKSANERGHSPLGGAVGVLEKSHSIKVTTFMSHSWVVTSRPSSTAESNTYAPFVVKSGEVVTMAAHHHS